MAKQLVNPQIRVNNIPISILANSFQYTEGLGERKTKVQSTGGNNVQVVECEDIETKVSKFKFSMLPTIQNIETARQIKILGNNNVITASESDETGATFNRVFTQAQITNDYEIIIQAEGNIELEFQSAPAV